MCKLAIGVPTYNRADMVEEMLIRCAEIYQNKGVDIYFFDSSPDERTEVIVLRYKAEYENVYYRKFPADTHSNIKVLEIYKELLGIAEYEYLWLCPDYMQLTPPGLEFVLCQCDRELDAFVLNYRDVEHIGRKAYKDADTFFLDCAWHMSSYMATVIRSASFMDIEWEKFYERYTVPERINFSHLAFYFEQLAKLPEIKAAHVPVSPSHIRVSSYRENSFWKKEVFYTWCTCWPDTIRALPERYHYKDEVIFKQGINSRILSWNNFLSLRREKIYDIHVYQKYRSEWKNLTDVPGMRLLLLSILPSFAIKGSRYNRKRERIKRRLRKFCKNNPKLYIYGCGYVSRMTTALLKELHIKSEGYIVSDPSGEKKVFNGLKVISCEEFLEKETDASIIFALKKEHADQVMNEHQQLELFRIFFMYPYVNDMEILS